MKDNKQILEIKVLINGKENIEWSKELTRLHYDLLEQICKECTNGTDDINERFYKATGEMPCSEEPFNNK